MAIVEVEDSILGQPASQHCDQYQGQTSHAVFLRCPKSIDYLLSLVLVLGTYVIMAISEYCMSYETS